MGSRGSSSTSWSMPRSQSRSQTAPSTRCESRREGPMSELKNTIQQVIENEPVAIFMKGTPQFVMCGNSDRALRALREAGAPVTAVNILADPAIRQELQEVSGWPTIPQVFVKGELVGGADITQELAESGELTQILEDRLGADYRSDAEERVVDVLATA